MNTLKIIGVAALVAIIASAGTFAFAPTRTEVITKLGSGGPVINSPFLIWGGINTTNGRMESLTQATTTVCAIQAPAATSTLRHGSIRFDVSSTTATVISIAKASTAFATTTLIASTTISANAQSAIVAATTTQYGIAGQAFTLRQYNDLIFAPNEWFVVGMQGGTGTFSPTGMCQASWTVL